MGTVQARHNDMLVTRGALLVRVVDPSSECAPSRMRITVIPAITYEDFRDFRDDYGTVDLSGILFENNCITSFVLNYISVFTFSIIL